MKRDFETMSVPRIAHRLQSKREALCIAILATALTLEQPVTGFQVASVHSICEFAATVMLYFRQRLSQLHPEMFRVAAFFPVSQLR
jgi:hypothetical protein